MKRKAKFGFDDSNWEGRNNVNTPFTILTNIAQKPSLLDKCVGSSNENICKGLHGFSSIKQPSDLQCLTRHHLKHSICYCHFYLKICC